MLAVCATAFAAIAFDVNSSTSLHLLQPLDSAVHGAVSSNVPLSVRIWASHELSDLPVSAACVAGWLCLGTILLKAPRTAALTAAAATLLNVAVGGVGVGKDASATLALKAFFARARPSSDFIAAPSFPSGHSTSVFAVMGLLFLVLLPTLNALSPRQSQASDNSSESSGKGLLAAVAQPRVGLAATFAGSSVTVAGRLLADVHWATDTMAGACLGLGGVAGILMLLEALSHTGGPDVSA